MFSKRQHRRFNIMHCVICNEHLPLGQKWPSEDLCVNCRHEIRMTILDNEYQDKEIGYLEYPR